MSWGSDCLLLSCVLRSSFCSTAQLWVKAEKLYENYKERKVNHLHSAGRDKISEMMPWNDTSGMLPAVCQQQEVVMTLISKVVSSCLQWCFHPYCMFPGQNSACYLLKEMRPCICAFPLPSCGSCLHFPKAILSNFNQNLYNTDFPNALNCLLTERQMTDCYC